VIGTAIGLNLLFGIPLEMGVIFTANKGKMGELVAPRWVTGLAVLIAVTVITLNVKLIWDFVAAL
jgi:manganese transport protein